MTRRFRHQALYLLALAIASTTSAFASHTGVGSGGDVMMAYMDETRYALIKTLQLLPQLKPAQRAALCQGQGLTPTQEGDCSTFLVAVANGMQALHIGPAPVAFQLSPDPLFVDGADGKPMRVAAETMTGPSGAITFDYELIAPRSPKLMMALLGHESGHKVPIPGSQPLAYVGDNEPIYSFATGRALLDAVGLALGNLALEQGIIGESFFILDHYSCVITAHADHDSTTSMSGVDIRKFFGPATGTARYDSFTTGIGPGHTLQIGQPDGHGCLSYQVLLHEQNGCRAEAPAEERYVDLQLVKIFLKDPNDPTKPVPPPQILKVRHLSGFNPACADDQTAETPMTLDYNNVTYTCIYKGMQGGAHLSVAKIDEGCSP